ncbi:IS1 family transposase [Pseudanabaena sp. PCC 6802]|uniref:IS1 family transposase n=1 Tax=Pseudanabaena sp. PCC 6802 TaxID=118173 RepID=UPI0039A0813F
MKTWLEPFGISQFYTDGWGAYERHLDPAELTVANKILKKLSANIATFRTRIKRLVRKTICF